MNQKNEYVFTIEHKGIKNISNININLGKKEESIPILYLPKGIMNNNSLWDGDFVINSIKKIKENDPILIGLYYEDNWKTIINESECKDYCKNFIKENNDFYNNIDDLVKTLTKQKKYDAPNEMGKVERIILYVDDN